MYVCNQLSFTTFLCGDTRILLGEKANNLEKELLISHVVLSSNGWYMRFTTQTQARVCSHTHTHTIHKNNKIRE